MIEGKLLGGEKLQQKAKGWGPKFRTGLSTTIKRLTLTLLANVKSGKLSGQVLNVRTGRLRRSINQRIVGEDSDVIQGIVGTNLVYARPHEYGFHGSVPVKAHMRTIKQAFGKSITPVQVQVGSYSMNMNLPERSFLRSALADMEPEIKSQLRNAVTEAIK